MSEKKKEKLDINTAYALFYEHYVKLKEQKKLLEILFENKIIDNRAYITAIGRIVAAKKALENLEREIKEKDPYVITSGEELMEMLES